MNATAPSASDLGYVTSLDEIFWGVVLIALTMVIHAFGIMVTLRAGHAMQRHHRRVHRMNFFSGVSTLIIATWILIIFHLTEVLMWGSFFWLKSAFPNLSTSAYYGLMQYTTVGSIYNLPVQLRLLGGMIAMAGLLTFAWSTSVLFTLAQYFQARQLGDPPDPTA